MVRIFSFYRFLLLIWDFMAPEDEHGGDTWHLRHRFNYITSKHTRVFVRLVIEFFYK
jgi:hypothetical protein